LWPSQQGALGAPRGDIRLGFCTNCGHIFNVAFEQERMAYSQTYENSLCFSPRFQDYASSLARRLVEDYDLHDKEIIEIGSGQGDFLRLLCELGNNRGIGFDPSYAPGNPVQLAAGQVSFVKEYYSERHAGHQADLVCCRHVLEHLDAPMNLLSMLRRMADSRSGTLLFFEVPNVLATLRDLAIWDIIYEHCSYFGPSSLSHAFLSSGFDVQKIGEAFGGQFLYVEATPGMGRFVTESVEVNAQAMAPDVAAFSARYRTKTEAWQRDLQQAVGAARRTVVWGAGSKGVTFLNILPNSDQISYVVDINPRKHGMFVAGSGQEIVPPSFLREYRPDVVVVMNAIYQDEIRRTMEDLGLSVEFLVA